MRKKLQDAVKDKIVRTPKRMYIYTCECGKYHSERNRKFSDKMLFRKTACCGTMAKDLKVAMKLI